MRTRTERDQLPKIVYQLTKLRLESSFDLQKKQLNSYSEKVLWKPEISVECEV
jgi:hypothetical protein